MTAVARMDPTRLSRLPKAELHCHVEATATPAFARELAARDNRPLPPAREDGSWIWHDFSSFLAAYDAVAGLLRTEDDYRRLARDYLLRISAEGAIYGELFASPDHAEAAGLPADAYLSALSEGLAEAERKADIPARLIVVGIRHLGPERVEAAARIAAKAATRLPVTGFGLAGDERLHRPRDFARAFDIARDAGLGLTAHAGEFCGADAIRETLDALKVSRLGHGVRAVEDTELVGRLAGEGIVLETCPHSNLALGVYPSQEAPPLRRLYEAGVRVTVNSDDPPFFETTLGREYAFTAAQGFSEAELTHLTRTAIEAAFCDEPTRRRCLDRLMTRAISLGAPGPSR